MGGCRCSFRSCPVSTSRNPGMHFFHFPMKQKERFAKWIQMAGVPHLFNMPLSVAKNRVVCVRHFRDECFMNYKRDRLVCNDTAIPTLMRLNDKMAWDYAEATDHTGPKLIQLNTVTMAHLIPPPEYECPFTLHDNLPNNYAPYEEGTDHNSGAKRFTAEHAQEKVLKRNCSPTAVGPTAKTGKIKNKSTPTRAHIKPKSSVDVEPVVSISLDLSDLDVKCEESESGEYLEFVLEQLEQPTDAEDATEMKLITKDQHEVACKSLEQKLEHITNEYKAEAERMLARVYHLEGALESVEQKCNEKTQQLETAETDLVNSDKKHEMVCKENAQLHTKCLAYEEKNAALEAELRLLKGENDALQQKCTELHRKQQLQQQQVEKVSTSAPAAVAASAEPVRTAAKQALTKGQLFNNIKKYMSTSMAALLRMEMFGSAEREWKPDERRAAMDLLQLGENVYKYVNDEWRMRLPPMRQVRTWLDEDDVDVDDEDL